MSDVGKVKGDMGGPEKKSSKKKGLDSDAFREMMKVDKTREVDPEEKRKRKRREEAEAEMQAQQTARHPLKQGLPTEEKKAVTPFEAAAGKEALGAEAPEARGAPSGAEAPQPPQEPPPTQEPPPPPLPPSEEPEEPSETTISPTQEQAPTQRKTKTAKKKAAAPATKAAPTTKKKVKPGMQPKKEEVAKKKEMAPPSKMKAEEGKEAFFETLAQPEKPKEEEKKIEEPLGALPELPEGAWEATKAPEKEEKKEGPTGAETTDVVPTPMPTTPSAPPAQVQAPLAPFATPFANLHPQVAEFFDRMVGVMTVMNLSGITETVVNLDNPRFAHSVFYGSQIVITEFSTAPKEFNIELLGNQQATALFAANAEELVAAFQGEEYNFKVHRVATGVLPSSADAKRKKVERVKRKKRGEP